MHVEYISKTLAKGYDCKFDLFTFHFLIVPNRNHSQQYNGAFFLSAAFQINCSFSDWKPQSQHNFVRRHTRASINSKKHLFRCKIYFTVKCSNIDKWKNRNGYLRKSGKSLKRRCRSTVFTLMNFQMHSFTFNRLQSQTFNFAFHHPQWGALTHWHKVRLTLKLLCSDKLVTHF